VISGQSISFHCFATNMQRQIPLLEEITSTTCIDCFALFMPLSDEQYRAVRNDKEARRLKYADHAKKRRSGDATNNYLLIREAPTEGHWKSRVNNRPVSMTTFH
jgi:hypothetical protein